MATRKERPTFSVELGRFFEHLRTDHTELTQRGAARMAQRLGFGEVSYNLVQRLEAGKLKFPTKEYLIALATVYSVPYEQIVAQVTEHLYGVKLIPAETQDAGVTYSPHSSITSADTSPHAASSAPIHREGQAEIARAFEAIARGLDAIKGTILPTTGSRGPHTRGDGSAHPNKSNGSGHRGHAHRKAAGR